ncbi:MAG: Flp/Fap pilin component [Phycisphaerales bacterium]|nr:Flp/Fap pilin component [Phycisphaerales bacterium]
MSSARQMYRTVRAGGAAAGRAAGRLAADDGGAELIEYVLIAGLIIVGTIAVIAGFGTKVVAKWTSVSSSSL